MLLAKDRGDEALHQPADRDQHGHEDDENTINRSGHSRPHFYLCACFPAKPNIHLAEIAGNRLPDEMGRSFASAPSPSTQSAKVWLPGPDFRSTGAVCLLAKSSRRLIEMGDIPELFLSVAARCAYTISTPTDANDGEQPRDIRKGNTTFCRIFWTTSDARDNRLLTLHGRGQGWNTLGSTS